MPRPSAYLDTVPRPSVMPCKGALAECHDKPRQGALAYCMPRHGDSPSACLDTVPRPSAMTCLGKVPRLSAYLDTLTRACPCLDTVPRPSVVTCLGKAPRPSESLNIMPRLSAIPSKGAST